MNDSRRDTAVEIVEYRGGHLRVTGPPGSGKTALLLKRYRYLSDVVGGPDNVAVIAYTRQNHSILTTELLKKNKARFGKTPVYTYHQLALEILSGATAAGQRLIGSMEERVVLSRIIRGRGVLTSDYASVAGSDALQRSLLRVFQVLQQHVLTEDELDRLIGTAEGARVRDIFSLFRKYRSYLDSHGFFTYFDVAWRAAKLLAARPELNPLRGKTALLIDDFHDVDAGQYDLVSAMAPASGPVEVTVFGDPCGARFRDRGTTDRFLFEVFPADYAPRDFELPMVCRNSPALGSTMDALLDEIVAGRNNKAFTRDHGASQPSSSAEALEVCLDVAEDEVAESQAVAERAAKLIFSGARRPGEIAVVARTKDKYERVLSRAFADRGIILESGRRERYALEMFMRSCLFLLERPHDETTLDAVVNSPFYPKFKTYLQENLNQGQNALPGGSEAAELETMMTRVSRSATGKDGFGMGKFLDAYFRPVIKELGSTRVSEGMLSFLSALVEEWDRYCVLVKRVGDKPALTEFMKTSGVFTERDGGAPVAAERVGFYSCREISAVRPAVLFMVGCSEFLFPKPPVYEGYVPFKSLQKCVDEALSSARIEFHQARPAEAHLKDEYALMLDALTRGGEAVYVTAPQKHDGEYCPAPAVILTGIPRGEPGSTIERSPASSVKLAEMIAAVRRRLDDEGAIASDEAAVSLAKSAEGIGQIWIEPRPEPRPLQVRERPLSPTSLQTYTVCERKYFYTRVLKVEEEESINLTYGSLFHALLQRICEDSRTYGALAKAIDSERLEQYIDAVLEGESGLVADALVEQATRHHLRESASRFLALEANRVDDFRIKATEERMDFCHQGRRFTGVLDRLDRSVGEGTVTLDYKTGAGSVPKTGKTVRKRVLPGGEHPDQRLWQVPFYCRAVGDSEKRYPNMFAYYVVDPAKDTFAAGVVIGEQEARQDPNAVFQDKVQAKFGHVTPDELETCLDEAAAVAAEMFAERRGFPKTEYEQRCRNCPYKHVCEREQ